MQFKLFFIALMSGVITLISCNPDPVVNDDLVSIPYNPTPYELNLPKHFPAMVIPVDNPITEQGVELGRHLFYDPILSKDLSMSCASCHMPEQGFSDGKKVSIGIDGIGGKRSSMSLINVGFVTSGLFWDGRAKTLEEQALQPVEDPVELHNTWPNVITQIRATNLYPKLFREAFGISSSDQITKELAAKAIAQFERTLISKDAKLDRILAGKEIFTDQELIGFGMYFDLDNDVPRAECGHCHNTPMGASDGFFNNGIQTAATIDDFLDKGRGPVVGTRVDNGKFRAPSLRNIRFSSPYMHTGEFSTLDEVLHHYNSGGKPSPNKSADLHPLRLDDYYLESLKAFILTMEDTVFLNNPKFKSPF